MEVLGVTQMFSSYTKIADTLQLEPDMDHIAAADPSPAPGGPPRPVEQSTARRRRGAGRRSATVFAQGRAGEGEKALNVGLGVGEGEVELRRHRVQEDAAAEETQQERPGAHPVGVEGAAIVDDLVIREDDRRERPIALDLRGDPSSFSTVVRPPRSDWPSAKRRGYVPGRRSSVRVATAAAAETGLPAMLEANQT